MKKTISNNSYSNLVSKLKKEMTKGLLQAQRAYDKEKIITYWNIGKMIHNHFLKNKVQADFGKQIYKNLSTDLNITETLLYQMTAFYKTYPVLKASNTLKWSHYRLLAYVKDNKLRKELEQKVSTDKLSNRNLAVLVKDFRTWFPPSEKKAQIKGSTKLKTTRGKLYHYQMFKTRFSKNYLIDCGFNIFRETDFSRFPASSSGGSAFGGKSIFAESIKSKETYSYKPSNVKKQYMYAYIAHIDKIIDGDTIWFQIDLGFNTWTRQNLRFMGIEAEALGTKEGKNAFEYVKAVLKGLPFVIIKSYWKGKFGRYLTDIYYLPNEDDPQVVMEKGYFLNQEMLDKGLVTPLSFD